MMHFCKEQHLIKSSKDFDKLVTSLRSIYRTNLSKNEMKDWINNYDKNINDIVSRCLVKKATRSQSGVLVATITLSPHKFSCTEKCSYCPQETDLQGNHTQPKSYTSAEPAMLRALRYNFDIREQFWDRISCYIGTGNIIDNDNVDSKKMEVILSGGTWESYPLQERERFILECYWAANTYRGSDRSRKCLSLVEEQLINETAEFRIIGLTLETRPDYINKTSIKLYRKYGVTRIQIGVQHTDDDILQKLNRNCTLQDTKNAIMLLKQVGLKVVVHLMPDLPGSNPEKDIKMFKTVLNDPNLQFDDVKIYPTAVTKPHNDKLILKSDISDWYEQVIYVPYAEQDIEQLIRVLRYYLENIKPWNRVQRLIRDFPVTNIEAGYSKVTNLRQIILDKIEKDGKKTYDMRTMEIREGDFRSCVPRLIVRKYEASKGIEYHISIEMYQENWINWLCYCIFCIWYFVCLFYGRKIYYSGNTDYVGLVGFLRLRIDKNAGAGFIKEIENCGLIRELHVYGSVQSVKHDKIDDIINEGYQHKGYGKKMMECAENIIYSHGYKYAAVIAGIGVKRYYQEKCGYTKCGTYMKKEINQINIISIIGIVNILITLCIILKLTNF